MRALNTGVYCIATLVLLLALGCGGESATPGESDDVGTTSAGTTTGDVTDGVDIPGGEIGQDVIDDPEYKECEENADCDSNWCVVTQDGSVCTELCVENCPKGYKCKATNPGGSDPVSLCVPDYLSLCFPCTTDSDCSNVPGALVPDEGARCISHGVDGSFCGGACNSDEECPHDFSCKSSTVGGESEAGAEETAMLCVPDSGECDCSPLAASLGASGQCYVQNDTARCYGERSCEGGELSNCSAMAATEEICDGLDNDCNDETDEGLDPTPATKQGGVCLESMVVCDGANGWIEPNYAELSGYEATEVTCDGLDNDCDGTVDNGLEAPAAEMQLGVCAGAVKVCVGGGGWSEPNYAGIDGYETSETMCDGLDNDCDGEIDENLDAPLADMQDGVCAAAIKVCNGEAGWGEPDYTSVEGYNEDETSCDDLDNDCDGVTDEGYETGGTVSFEDSDGAVLGKSEDCGVGQCAGGTVVCGEDMESLTCSTLDKAGDELCDGQDNDCDPKTPDGADDPTLGLDCDGDDTDLCKEGAFTCVGGTFTCDDSADDDPDVCDGEDNDCNPNTPDGSGDPELGSLCDSVKDADLCNEGKQVCLGGALTCDDPGQENPDLCDGLDNDCNPLTADGSAQPTLGSPCDGNDTDLCEDGTFICQNGIMKCDDAEDLGPDYCNGIDDDCNPGTPDGFNDPALGTACDSPLDTDLCKEGKLVCKFATLSCDDPGNPSPDICDGLDNDCNPATFDGSSDAGVGVDCDGTDADLCEEGKMQCKGGSLVCNDINTLNLDMCDGADNDCNPGTPDGFNDPQAGVLCDSAVDSDLCKEGTLACKFGTLICNDPGSPNPDVCDGIDNDCNPATADGSQDSQVGLACDSDADADLCKEGNILCTGGTLSCNDPGLPNPDMCDGLDNDCNLSTLDGADDPQLGMDCDGTDADLCEEGTKLCIGGLFKCNDPNDVDAEVCDGVDNDCNPTTVDGSQDPLLGNLCDGDDADLCKEGTQICTNGLLSCNDPNDVDLDACDGQDNDCNPATPDGSQDPQLNSPCDGSDADLCDEGKTLCAGGSLTCDDANTNNPDICDGVDNDCNPATADGSGDTKVGLDCDGDNDTDLCKEGSMICTGGTLFCTDAGDADPDVCDGMDNDCNPATLDGSQDPLLGDPCDGGDLDLCKEGVRVCTAGTLSCNDNNDVDVEICDGVDNDCNPATLDGSQDPLLGNPCDGNDADLCKEGENVCVGGSLGCTDVNDIDVESCDGVDNDCNPLTPDGSQDPNLGAACDGDDADACKEGVRICTAGTLSCNDPNDVDVELCDGVDNDCLPSTADGSQDPQLGKACDGNDADLCKEGFNLCAGGNLICDDPGDIDLDVCDGVDNDCNPATQDGSQDPQLLTSCDGSDLDKCNEGIRICQGGSLFCNDPNDVDKDVCDGVDNDCNPNTADGSQDPQLGLVCDGDDADLCKEGNQVCANGVIGCNDPNDLDLEVCDGADNDCNPATSDGSQDSQLGAACDGTDPDLCKEGSKLCSGGNMICNDTNDLDLEYCDGVDNDCNPNTADGSQDPQLNVSCDGNDADLCKEGGKICSGGNLVCNDPNTVTLDVCDGSDNDCNPNTKDGSQAVSAWSSSCSGAAAKKVSVGKVSSQVVATGGFNRVSPLDWIQFAFTAPPGSTNFQRSLTLSGNGYRMVAYTACNTVFPGCGTSLTTWSTSYAYSHGIGCCSDGLAKPNTVRIKVFRSSITNTCESYSITAKNTW